MGNSAINYPINAHVLRSRAITEADTNATVTIMQIPAGTLVLKMWIVITTLFAGGTPSIDIGDAADADGWIDTTDITEATAGTYGASETNTGAYSDDGKYYAAATAITAVVATGLTAGKAYVFALCVPIAEVLD